ncbi:alpha/beta hydrolase fold domain-containing protein [Nocardia farcinica]|uniref:alpha/beta hydrolase fold domain-containing protein n=1 Tax=Nocardia farcinica TaxID=37329 RepID=UPI0009D754B2|nr:alpha/beta hydrolase fold domain-containing protein [Nocardia farcinica]
MRPDVPRPTGVGLGRSSAVARRLGDARFGAEFLSTSLPLPAAVMPMSPWYDMALTGATLDTLAHLDAVVQRPLLARMRAAYLGDHSPTTPLANPLHADLDGFPPTLIYTGAEETLVSDTERFAERARAAGVDIHYEIAPGMQHSFAFLAGRAPEADDAVAHMAAWLRRHLGLAPAGA